jgi:hypothetical protein
MPERNEYFSGDFLPQPSVYVDDGALFDLKAKAQSLRPIDNPEELALVDELVIEHDLYTMHEIAGEVEEWSRGARTLETPLDSAVILYRHTRIANPLVPDPMNTYFHPVSRINDDSILYSRIYMKEVLGDRKPLQIALQTGSTKVEPDNTISLTPDYINELIKRPTTITANVPPRQPRTNGWRTRRPVEEVFKPSGTDIREFTKGLMRHYSGAIVLKHALKPRFTFE